MSRSRASQRGDGIALLIVDVINTFEFPEGDRLLRQAMPMARRIARLKARCVQAGVPVIYANDNYGQWRSNFAEVVAACRGPGRKGADIVDLLAPQPTDYFILKPQQSAFFRTPLADLLEKLEVGTVWLAGIAGDGCVLATAIGAKMREFDVAIPADCTASVSAMRNSRALAVLRDAMELSVRSSRSLRLK